MLSSTAVLVGIALLGLSAVNEDARWLVISATVVGGAAGLASAVLLRHGSTRLAGVLVIVSAVTPTYAAAALNLVPIVLGVVLLFRGRRAATGRSPEAPSQIGGEMAV